MKASDGQKSFKLDISYFGLGTKGRSFFYQIKIKADKFHSMSDIYFQNTDKKFKNANQKFKNADK